MSDIVNKATVREVVLKVNEGYYNLRRFDADSARAVKAGTISRISSEFIGGVAMRPLPVGSLIEAMIMPEMVEAPYDSDEFAKKVTDFWSDYTVDLTAKRVMLLNASTREYKLTNEERTRFRTQEDTIEFPINPREYLMYLWAMASSRVAKSEVEIESGQFEFVLLDKVVEAKLEDEATDRDLRASAILLKLVKELADPDKEISDRAAIKAKQIIFMAKDKVTYKPEMSPTELKTALNKLKGYDYGRFYTLATNPDLDTIALLEQLLHYDVLQQSGLSYYSKDSTSAIASSKEEMLRFLKDERNSQQVAGLRATMEQRITRPIQLK